MMTTKRVMLVALVVLLSGTLIALTHAEKMLKFAGQDHAITLQEAQEFTGSFQKNAAEDAIIGGFFAKEAVTAILEQEGCVGLRYYYGLHEGKPVLVLVGVDENGNDMYDGLLAEKSTPCPPMCSETNPLNAPQINVSSLDL